MIGQVSNNLVQLFRMIFEWRKRGGKVLKMLAVFGQGKVGGHRRLGHDYDGCQAKSNAEKCGNDSHPMLGAAAAPCAGGACPTASIINCRSKASLRMR